MKENIKVNKKEMQQKLTLLVNGLQNLKKNALYDEPNLDGSPSDYISFESWEWPQGVGLYGLWRYYEHTQDPKQLIWLQNWYQRRFKEGLPKQNINTTAPMFALSFLYEQTNNETYKAILTQWADDILTQFPRTEEGGFQHLVSDGVNPQQLWDDTLFMVVLFLANLGKILNRQDYKDEAIKQFLLHSKYLVDTKTGLWFHGWTFDGRHNFANALWARGNAWISAGILDFIEILDIKDGVSSYLIETLLGQLKTLLKLQAKSGLWHTLLDDPTSYTETSATAGFAYAFLKAHRLKLVNDEYQQAGLKALVAVLNEISPQGVVQHVSYGTRMGHDLQFYKDIPIEPMSYGQSLAIMLLVEGLWHVA